MRRKTAIKNNNLLKTVQLLLFTTVIVACVALAKFRTAMGSSVVAIMANPKTIFTDQVNLSSLKPGGSITSNFTTTLSLTLLLSPFVIYPVCPSLSINSTIL